MLSLSHLTQSDREPLRGMSSRPKQRVGISRCERQHLAWQSTSRCLCQLPLRRRKRENQDEQNSTRPSNRSTTSHGSLRLSFHLKNGSLGASTGRSTLPTYAGLGGYLVIGRFSPMLNIALTYGLVSVTHMGTSDQSSGSAFFFRL